MSAVGLLLGLLVLSYLGSILVGDRTIRGFGLPSGAEYLLVGFVIGPEVLGVVPRPLVEQFRPALIVGVAWLALVQSTGYLQVASRRIGFWRALAGILLSAFVGAGVAAIVALALALWTREPWTRHWLAAAAAGVVCSETTRQAVRWVAERHAARGGLLDALADFARVSVLVPALGLCALFAAGLGGGVAFLPVEGRAALTLGVGLALGLVAAILLGREFRRDESWGILLGTTLLGAGLSARLGLSVIATTFALGLTLSALSKHRAELKAMVAPTEKPVMMPLLLLAGALLEARTDRDTLVFVGAGVAGRLLLELLRGRLLATFLGAARPAGSAIGFALLPSGPFSLGAGVLLYFALPAPLGARVLLLAASSLLVGELLGPSALRRALDRAGELFAVQGDGPPAMPDSIAPPGETER